MAGNAKNSPESAPKKPSLVESVDSLISKKKAESAHEGARIVQESAQGVQNEVAEVMAGAEKPKEDLSEKGEKKSDGDLKTGGGGTAAQDAGGGMSWAHAIFPSETVMIKKVRTAIELQIKVEWKKAQRLRGSVTEGGAQEYGQTISRIRRLKNILSNLFSATFEYVKEMYMKYFQPDGKQRDPDTVEIED